MGEPATVEIDGQYRVLREGTALVDRSDRAKLLITGPEAAEYLESQLTNEVESLAPGKGCYAALLDRKGRMRADLRILRLAAERVWIDAEPAGAAALASHLERYRIGRTLEIEDLGVERSLLSLLGPGAIEVAGGTPPGPEHSHRELELGGVRCLHVATDLGVDLICDAADRERLREALAAAGAEQIAPEAAEIARVESGRPRFGAEMGTETIPEEAGINERAVSFEKGCYIGQETVARLHFKGKPNRHLRGLRLERPVAAGEMIRLGEREVGTVGTAVLSPALGPIALAIVRREAGPGDAVSIGAEGVGAEVVELPFARP